MQRLDRLARRITMTLRRYACTISLGSFPFGFGWRWHGDFPCQVYDSGRHKANRFTSLTKRASAMNVYCPKCEAANHEDTEVCSMCGWPLKKSAKKSPPATVPIERPSNRFHPSFMSLLKANLAADLKKPLDSNTKDPRQTQVGLGLILLIIIVFVPLYALISGDSETARSVHKVSEPTQTTEPIRSAGELEDLIQNLKSTGIITWVHVDLNQARVDLAT